MSEIFPQRLSGCQLRQIRERANDELDFDQVLVVDDLLASRIALATKDAEIAAVMAALSGILDYAESYTDEGPPDEGWQSPEVKRALAAARAALEMSGGVK